MAEVLIEYTAGADQGGAQAWTSPANAFDQNAGTYASKMNLLQFTWSNILLGTTNNNIRSTGTITKVEIGIKGYQGGPGPSTFYALPKFNGSTYGTAVNMTAAISDTLNWADVTSVTSAPNPWTWADINNLDAGARAYSTSGIRTWYVNSIHLRVTYTEGWSSSHKLNNLGGFSKVNGISSFSKINGM